MDTCTPISFKTECTKHCLSEYQHRHLPFPERKGGGYCYTGSDTFCT